MLEVRLGDCIEGMAALDADSVDAIVCDPPYGLEFMGADWDTFRVDERSARWASQSGAAGSFAESLMGTLPNFGKRRTTSQCLTCGKRDAFRNPHACDPNAEWVTIHVDRVPVEMRAFQNWCFTWACEAFRVLKPGGHLLAFGGSRTYHRLAGGVEDAGFDVRDQLMWIYGSGFPKSLNVERAVDGQLGADTTSDERWRANGRERPLPSGREGVKFGQLDAAKHPVGSHDYVPEHDAAASWHGWGTALKPAHEPIVLARKPLSGTVAETVLQHGTGALNIDESRIKTAGEEPYTYPNGREGNTGRGVAFDGQGLGRREEPVSGSTLGRWPANVLLGHHPDCRGYGTKRTSTLCHPECPVRMMNDQSGESKSPDKPVRQGGGVGYTPGQDYTLPRSTGYGIGYGDQGGAARFFYTAKAATKERINGVERSLHPTVKPVAVMRWLIRLVTPPGGLVLDPFAGSGTTGVACVLEGFDFLGFDQDETYARQAAERIADHAFARGRKLTSPPASATTPSSGAIAIGAVADDPEEGRDDEGEERTRGADRGAARERRPDERQGRNGRGGEAGAGDEGQDADRDAGGDDLHGVEEGRNVPGAGTRRRRTRRGDAGRTGADRGAESGGDAGVSRRQGGRGQAGPEAAADGEEAAAESEAEGRSDRLTESSTETPEVAAPPASSLEGENP